MTVSQDLLKGKKVLLRLDLDVPLNNLQVAEDYRLKAALPTIKLCAENADQVIMMGHLGRPKGVDQAFSLKPVARWLEENLNLKVSFIDGLNGLGNLANLKLILLENLRFNPGEDLSDPGFAKRLASLGDLFINEAFASHHASASTTTLPLLLPHVMGLRFAKEVELLGEVRKNPKKPLVAIIGGVKIEDKYPASLELSKFCDAVLVGGLLAQKIKEQKLQTPTNMMVGKLSESGIDMAEDTIDAFISLVKNAKQVIWSGPLGKYEDSQGNIGNKRLAEAIIASGADSIVGGGDTIAALEKLGLLEKFSFVSTGGGAMLEFLAKGTLPTVEALG